MQLTFNEVELWLRTGCSRQALLDQKLVFRVMVMVLATGMWVLFDLSVARPVPST